MSATAAGLGAALVADVGTTFSHTVTSGSLLLAVPVALLAGVVSFLSPCVLPLVPGYLSYVTGLSGADLADAGRRHRRGRVLLGSLLFVLGFSTVYVLEGTLFGALGRTLLVHAEVLARVLGVVTIVLGLAFLGVVPGFSRDLRIHRTPTAGIVTAPVLGFLFGLGWTPCIGPTLGAVLGLSLVQGGAGRGALLTLAYCLGLGVPFIVAALAFRRALGAFAFVRRHYAWVMRVGGALLVGVGVLLVTGWWNDFLSYLQPVTSGSTPAV